MNRRKQAITLLEATQDSPGLARLAGLAAESNARFQAIAPLLPTGLRLSVRPGPLEDGVWCLLLPGNAAAAKVRQLLPALLAHLRSKGWEQDSIRLKVLQASDTST